MLLALTRDTSQVRLVSLQQSKADQNTPTISPPSRISKFWRTDTAVSKVHDVRAKELKNETMLASIGFTTPYL